MNDNNEEQPIKDWSAEAYEVIAKDPEWIEHQQAARARRHLRRDWDEPEERPFDPEEFKQRKARLVEKFAHIPRVEVGPIPPHVQRGLVSELDWTRRVWAVTEAKRWAEQVGVPEEDAVSAYQAFQRHLRRGGKDCPSCQRHLPLGRFGKNLSRHDGLDGWCRDCSNSFKRAARQQKREAPND